MIVYRPMELHTHTMHSDGDFTPETLLEAAQDFGYAGIALTDHNTDAGLQACTSALQERTVPVVPGIEWTTYFGHMLVLGCDSYVDWRFAVPETIDRYIAQVVQANGVAGIAHPFSMGGVLYTGGFWEFQVHDWSKVSYIEVWSKGENDERIENERALAWWTELLNNGNRLALTSGRDWHRPDACPRLCAVTYVGLADGKITADTVKDALRAGRTYVTYGPALDVQAVQGGQLYGLGDTLHTGQAAITVAVDETARREHWAVWDVCPHTVQLVCNGEVLAEQPYTGVPVTFVKTLPFGWCRIELRGRCKNSVRKNALLAMSSPLYVES